MMLSLLVTQTYRHQAHPAGSTIPGRRLQVSDARRGPWSLASGIRASNGLLLASNERLEDTATTAQPEGSSCTPSVRTGAPLETNAFLMASTPHRLGQPRGGNLA